MTAQGALRYFASQDETLADAARKLQVAPAEVPQQLDKVLLSVRELEREVSRLKAKLAGAFVDCARVSG